MVSLLNSIAESWATNFGMIILQNTLFLGLIFTALYLLKNTHASFKYMLALLGMIKLLLPPFIPGQISWFFQDPTTSISFGEISGLVISPAGSQVSIKPSLSLIFMLIWITTLVGYLLLSLLSTFILKTKLRTAQEFDMNVDIPIYISDKISSPLSIGILPKRIYVPTWWQSLPRSSQTSLLNHELAHIRRHDGLTQLFQTLAQALYFFHPLVWLLNERMNEYREMACDDLAVENARVSPNKYSQDLYKVAQKITEPQWSYISSSALIKHKYKLLNRVSYQLQEGAMQKENKIKKRAIVAILVLLILPFSWYCSQDNSTELNQSNAVETGQQSPPTETGKVWGKVTDANSGKAIHRALIELQGIDQGSALSDTEGNFYIPLVPPGMYSMKIHMHGYKSMIIKDIQVEPNQSSNVNVSLGEVINSHANAESAPPPPPVTDGTPDVFVEYDAPPKPVGGFEAIQKNLVYPKAELNTGKTGRVVVRCKVNTDGTVGEAVIMSSLSGDFDQAAINAIKSVLWEPATQAGKAVDVWIAVPVVFKMNTPASEAVEFVAYDTPPKPVGGFAAVQKKLIYPEIARKAGIEGRVVVRCLVDKAGNIADTEIMSSLGNNGCDESAINAIKAVKWEPATQRGKAIDVWIAIPVNFSLH